MKRLLIILLLPLLAANVAQTEETPVRATGLLCIKIFPGRPNYESIEKGDEAEKFWILTVSTGESKEDYQLAIMADAQRTYDLLRRSIGKKVTIDGTKWQAHTGHHHTPYLITINAIIEDS